jgi:predicted O-methyltransferase YrrM
LERAVRRGLRLLNGPPPAPPPLDTYAWDRRLPTMGIDFGDAIGLDLLHSVFPTYRAEYDRFPQEAVPGGGFYLANGYFEAVDAEVLYCLVRHFRPLEVIEVGSGFSTLITRMALQANGRASTLTAIDPEPRTSILGAIDHHVASPVEQIDPTLFDALNENDVLFIDSSHVISAQGDVNFLFFEVLPRLKRGVLVHIHDVFLPYEYPPRWMAAGNTEQYLLLAFLTSNREFEVVWAGHHMRMRYPHEVMATFSTCTQNTHPGSFWIRRR